MSALKQLKFKQMKDLDIEIGEEITINELTEIMKSCSHTVNSILNNETDCVDNFNQNGDEKGYNVEFIDISEGERALDSIVKITDIWEL